MLLRPFNLEREQVLTVAEAAKYLRVSPKTVRRWIERGVQRAGSRGNVQLQAVLAGAEYRTSLESLVRFSDALSGSEVQGTVRRGVSEAVKAGVDRVHQQAVKELRRAGYGT